MEGVSRKPMVWKIQKMTAKMSEKVKIVIYIRLRAVCEIRAEESPLRFSWVKENMFIYLQIDW